MKLSWSTHFISILQSCVSSMGPACLEINLHVSPSCVRLTVLHHELSRYVCLITEQLFKFLSGWPPCSHQSLFMMHCFSSGRNDNLLNRRLDSSILYVNFYFSSIASWTFWYVAFRRISGELEYTKLHECTIMSEEKQIRGFNYFSSWRAFASVLLLCWMFFFSSLERKKQILGWINLLYHLNRLGYQWGANWDSTQISKNHCHCSHYSDFSIRTKRKSNQKRPQV